MKHTLTFVILLIAVAATACGTTPPVATPTKAATASALSPLPPAPTQQPLPTILASPTIPPVTPTVVPPTPTLGNPLDALKNTFRGFAGVKSFRAKMTSTTGAATNQEMTLEVVVPDRFHMTSAQFEAYYITSTFYMKTGNTWQKIAMPKAFDLSLMDAKKIEADLGATTETKLIGAEVLDGTPTTVYQYTTTIKTPAPSTYTAKVWIGVADGLPRKLESTPKTGGKTTVAYYDYNNANIVISAPIK